MISTLKSLNIDTEKRLTMADMSSSYFKRGTSLSVAKYQLELSTSEQVVAVYDKLSEIGISDVTISRVSHTDIEQYKSRCRQEAMKNAKAVATELASAVGQNIGSCLHKVLPAVSFLMHRLQTAAPKANIYWMVNTGLNRKIRKGMLEACDHYKIQPICFRRINKTSGHPTIKGMKDIKNTLIASVEETK